MLPQLAPFGKLGASRIQRAAETVDFAPRRSFSLTGDNGVGYFFSGDEQESARPLPQGRRIRIDDD